MNEHASTALIQSIGKPTFGAALLAMIRRQTPIDHVVVFLFSDKDTQWLLTEGAIAQAEAERLARVYSQTLYPLDPAITLMQAVTEESAPIMNHSEAHRIGVPSYRDHFFTNTGLGFRLQLLYRSAEYLISTNLYRFSSSGGFTTAEQATIGASAELMIAAIERHAHFTARPPLQDPDEHNWPEAVKQLSARELEVARLIVAGYSNPAIAEGLKISENTVRTYRKRIYHKLAIHRQQELLQLLG